MFEHGLGDYVLVAGVRVAIQQLLGGRFGCEGQRGQCIHY